MPSSPEYAVGFADAFALDSIKRLQILFQFLQARHPACARTASLPPAQPSTRGPRSLSIRDTHPASDRAPQRPSRAGTACLSEQSSVSDRAANDLAQHIAAAFVRRKHSIGNQERCGARVVGDHPQRSCRTASVPSFARSGRRVARLYMLVSLRSILPRA